MTDVRFIGTKEIKATQMNRGEYNRYRGWLIPANENPQDDGYLVKYNDGYESWSPAKQFEDAYATDGKLSFGHAVYLLKQGKRVARAGWNGKGMFLAMIETTEWNASMLEEGFTALPWIGMKTADGCFVPWLASQTDILAEDYHEVV